MTMLHLISESPAPLVRRCAETNSTSSLTPSKSHPALHLNKEFEAKPATATVEPMTPIQYLRSIFPEDNRRNPYYNRSMQRFDGEDYNHDAAKAIRSSDLQALRELLEGGATFDGCNRNGESLLHLACRRCDDMDIIKFLIFEAEIPLDIRDSLGRTVLHDVCWKPQADFELMDFLIGQIHPSLLIAEDMRGHTPFDYARRSDHTQWNQYITKKRELIELRIALAA